MLLLIQVPYRQPRLVGSVPGQASSELLLSIERAARGFESFSLPEDGQAAGLGSL